MAPRRNSRIERPEDEFEAGPGLGVEAEIRRILGRVRGETSSREGLVRTPMRVDRSLGFLTRGYKMSVDRIVNGALFEETCEDMVIVRNIEFYSLCEHHMLPFFGTAHVAYIPNGRIIGLSKIPRIVEMFARRLQVQERLTRQVADCLMETLGAKGVGVVTDARHLCMMMRGVEKQQSSTTTSSMLGCFLDSPETRAEFLALARGD